MWRTGERLNVERDLGKFSLPEPQKDYPIDYVLDGQQRITSIFSVFQTELVPQNQEDSEWLDIYYDFHSNGDIQESKFIPLRKENFDPSKHFPMNVMFDSVRYRKATSLLPDKVVSEIDKIQEKLKEATIPIQIIETDNKNHVAIVFERVNRAGTPLDTFQLLSAWSWSTDFDLQDEFTQLSEELEPFGFGDIYLDKDLQLKCCSGVILGEASPNAIMNLRGVDVRSNFESIKNGIKSSIDFLQKELNLYSLKMVPYPAMIVSLSRFFATDKISGYSYTEKQRKQLIKWFWRASFARRYTSGVTDAHRQDIIAMDKLKMDENYNISSFYCHVDSNFFLNNQFSLAATNTKTYIALLSSKNPRSFISGQKVDLDTVLKLANRNEFHHIFPKKYLEKLGKSKKEINVLANLCFMSSADNQKIKDKSPNEYEAMIGPLFGHEVLNLAICPKDTFKMTYEDFCEERAKLLAEYVSTLIN